MKHTITSVMVLILIIGLLGVSTNSSAYSAPQKSVSLTFTYDLNGNEVAQLSGVQTSISMVGGAYSSTSTANPVSDMLTYGNYTLNVQPSFVTIPGIGKVISNGTQENFAVNAGSSSSLNILVPVTQTFLTNVSLSGLVSGESANLTFLTQSGFAFYSTTASSGFTTYLPHGVFYVNVNYLGTQFNILENNKVNSINVSLSSTQAAFGNVQTTSNSTINSFTAVLFNKVTDKYSTQNFNSGSYRIITNQSWSDLVLMIYAPGFAPTVVSKPVGNGLQTVTLYPSSSNIFVNYSLSSNLRTITMNLSLQLFNDSAISFLQNSSVGSIYYQELLDGGLFVKDLSAYVNDTIQNNTQNSLLINGNYYNLSKMTQINFKVNSNSAFDNITATYTNGLMNTSGYQNMKIKLYGIGTSAVSGSINHQYFIKYQNNSYSLSTASVTTTYGNPFQIYPVSSSQWINLAFSQAKKPFFINSQMSLSWKNMVSQSYTLNSTEKNTIFVAPANVNVTVNLSNAFYNPVNQKYDYNSPNTSFIWNVSENATAYKDYTTKSVTINLAPGSHTVFLNGTSSSGFYNTTSFIIYAVNSSVHQPVVNFTYSYLNSNGIKVHKEVNRTSLTSNLTYYFSVPQSTQISFTSDNSSLNLMINGSNYKVPLVVNWSFTNSYKTQGTSASYAFSKPTIPVNGYSNRQNVSINVTSVALSTLNITLKVFVNDTTPPTPQITIMNSAAKNITAPVASNVTILSANYSTDQYYGAVTNASLSSEWKYNWTFMNINSTADKQSSSTYEIVGGNASGSWIAVKFLNLSRVIVSLKLTNPSNISAYNNHTVNIIVKSPRLVVQNIYFTGSFQAGISKTIYVKIENIGTQTANNFTVYLFASGSMVANQAFTNKNLSVNSTVNVSITWTPSTAGTVSLVVNVSALNQPGFVSNLGEYSTDVNVASSPYNVPIIIGSVIAIIVVVGLIYYRVTAGKFPISKKKGDKTTSITPTKTTQPAVKKDDVKKEQPKK
ncbi:MAG: CARDB domain-containing protein [Thermoplasmataceae archaeon]